MAKLKIKNNVWSIIFKSMKIYSLNLYAYIKYMLFPVFGQVIGIILIFASASLFSQNMSYLSDKYEIFNNFSVVITTLLIIVMPGFILFLKAFWDFMVAYGALNSMTQSVLSTGKLYDFKAHDEVITKRSFKFISLLFVIAFLLLMAINPLLWVLDIIFFVYFILIFQVFTFEEDKSVIDCFKRSLGLIKGNFGRTFLIVTVLAGVTYYILPCLVEKVIEITHLSNFFKGILETWAMTLSLEEWNNLMIAYKLPIITALDIANSILSSTILFIVVGLTLPLRSICWTLWYKNLSERK